MNLLIRKNKYMKKKVLIFVVTYKASFRVLHLINKIPFSKLKNINYKILISDDNSEDEETTRYINLAKTKFKSKITLNFNKINLGYGANIKKCLNVAYKNHFDYAVMLHGDNQYNPKYIYNMFSTLQKNQNISAVCGSRMYSKKGALKGNMPIYKFLGNIFLTNLFNLIHKKTFTDCHTGYWAYNLKKIKKKIINKCDDKFCFDIDLRINLVNQNHIIKEIPINTFYGTERSSMHIIYALRFFFKIILSKFKNFNYK